MQNYVKASEKSKYLTIFKRKQSKKCKILEKKFTGCRRRAKFSKNRYCNNFVTLL